MSGGLVAALDAARGGNEAGVARLWRNLKLLVLRYLVVGQAAEDVASETWLAAAREIRRFRGNAAGFRAWLFRVDGHRALDEVRRSGRWREDPVGLSTRAEPVAEEDSAEQAVERLATRRALGLIAVCCAVKPRS